MMDSELKLDSVFHIFVQAKFANIDLILTWIQFFAPTASKKTLVIKVVIIDSKITISY
jgi:hypothetical protein